MGLISKTLLILTLGGSMSACSDQVKWKEEVLLHDGQKIVVERKAERYGSHELFQRPSIGNQSLIFILPGTTQPVIWEDKFSEDVGSANFNLMLLEILNDTAYVLGAPMGCLSYNKWGRPNPPYVVFKYQNKLWERVPLESLPSEFKLPNLIISSPDDQAQKAAVNGLVSAEKIKALNVGFKQPEYQSILRVPLPGNVWDCSEMIRTSRGWEGLGFFEYQPNHQACLEYCKLKGVQPAQCPCNTMFKEEK